MTTTNQSNKPNQNAFYRLPKQLIKGKRYQSISLESRLLYSLLLDRMHLSEKNGWQDGAGRVYIVYTQNEIMGDFGCSSKVVTRMVRELESVQLIERKKQGLGRPTLIYVSPLQSEEEPEADCHIAEDSTEAFDETAQSRQNDQSSCFQRECPEVPFGTVQSGQKGLSGQCQTTSPEVPFGNTNKTNINKLIVSKTDENQQKIKPAAAERAREGSPCGQVDTYPQLLITTESGAWQQEAAVQDAVVQEAVVEEGVMEETVVQEAVMKEKPTWVKDWHPEGFTELSLTERALLWKQHSQLQAG